MSSRKSVGGEKKAGAGRGVRAPGRPRCEATHRNILNAAREMVEAEGFDCLTMEGIAARAGVGKTTIYRRWPNKASIILDALFEEGVPSAAFPDTGDARRDIRRQMRRFVRELQGPLGCKLAALLAKGRLDEEMGKAFRERWIDPRRREAREVIERGVERGEIRRGVDPEVLVDALYGPIYFRLLGEHAPLTPGFADSLVDLVLGRPD